MTAFNHLADSFFSKPGGKMWTTHVTPLNGSIIASEVSTITGAIPDGQTKKL
jgi:hypothetical protein